jgi:glycosyltransferase involved in cell wall biosynthesis
MRVARTIHNTQLWSSHPRLGRITESTFTDDLIIPISDATREAYRNLRIRCGLAPSPWQVVIRHGFAPDAPVLTPTRSYLVERYGADQRRLQFCFAGRITRQKGVDTLVDAVSQLQDEELERFQLHVFGDGDERESISEIVRQRRLPIVMHMPEPDVERIFPAFDCLVLPSRYEGSPLVVGESLSRGVPIVVTAAPGLREAVPEWWPFVVSPDDPSGLANAIRHVVSSPRSSLRKLGVQARKWANRAHSYDEMIDRYERVFTLLHGGHLSDLSCDISRSWS